MSGPIRAAVVKRYGGPEVFELGEIELGTPGDKEVLIDNRASSINAGDWHLLHGRPAPLRLMFGLTRPSTPVLGLDVAGVVIAVGANVTRFAPGDEVFADVSSSGFGGFGTRVMTRENLVAHKPPSMSFLEAASLPAAAVTALQAARDHGRIQEGERVLVHGASGGVGGYAVQIAKATGAHVTAVTRGDKADWARELGADDVVDYQSQDFAERPARYDTILATGGSRKLADFARALQPNGRFVHVGGGFGQLLRVGLFGKLFARNGKTLTSMLARPNAEDLEMIGRWVEEEKIRPLVQRFFPLDAIGDAMRAFEDRAHRGKIALQIA